MPDNMGLSSTSITRTAGKNLPEITNSFTLRLYGYTSDLTLNAFLKVCLVQKLYTEFTITRDAWDYIPGTQE
jgi:hypothetical protein